MSQKTTPWAFPLVLLVLTLAAGCGTVPEPRPTSSPATSSPTSSSPATSSPPSSSPTPTLTSSTPSTPTPSSTPTPTAPTCRDLAATLSLDEQIGQLIMAATKSSGMSSHEATIFNRAHVGSVLLLGNSSSGRKAVGKVTGHIRSEIDVPQGIKLMLAADQEGGQVQRLQGQGFDRMPSATEQAQLSDHRLAEDAHDWGRQLAAAGIQANLAPVADVVPDSMIDTNQPIGKLRRGYGSDPDVVGDKVAAFIEGMDKAGIATSVKHFPGLGQVRGNTDFTADVTDTKTTRHDVDLAGFEQGVHAGTDMVMVSLARYTKIDPDHLAAFSATVIDQMIRGDLGFDGVVISDDLAAEAAAGYPPGDRALKFLRAGGDLMIVGDSDQLAAMTKAVKRAADADPDFAAQIQTKAARVIAMKARRGLAATCRP